MFNDDDIEGQLNEQINILMKRMVTMLAAAGEMFVKYARESGNYHDQTGNLRSSIGYVLFLDKNIIAQNILDSTDKEGPKKAKQLAIEVASDYTGFLLVGLAGMNYAASVEARGYDVVTGASYQCERWLRESIQSVLSKI